MVNVSRAGKKDLISTSARQAVKCRAKYASPNGDQLVLSSKKLQKDVHKKVERAKTLSKATQSTRERLSKLPFRRSMQWIHDISIQRILSHAKANFPSQFENAFPILERRYPLVRDLKRGSSEALHLTYETELDLCEIFNLEPPSTILARVYLPNPRKKMIRVKVPASRRKGLSGQAYWSQRTTKILGHIQSHAQSNPQEMEKWDKASSKFLSLRQKKNLSSLSSASEMRRFYKVLRAYYAGIKAPVPNPNSLLKTRGLKSDTKKVEHERKVQFEFPVPDYDVPIRMAQRELELLIPAKYEQVVQKAIERLPNAELLPADLKQRMAGVDVLLNKALEVKDRHDVGMVPYDAQSAFREIRRLSNEFKDDPDAIPRKKNVTQASPFCAPTIFVSSDPKQCFLGANASDEELETFKAQVKEVYAGSDMTRKRELAKLEAIPYEDRDEDDLDRIKELRLGL